jgi:branched-subunit amino acid aminotransferase/4-amino-4-deoxychorismate lyase
VTRGENGFLFLGSNTPTLCISSTQLTDYTPYQKGITLTAIHMSRLMPKAKTISLLPLILAKQAAQKAGAFECLFLNEKNEVTECSTSNVLYRNGNTLYIPAKTECLPGTMQRIFLEKVSAKGFVVQEKISSLKTVQDAEEVIITNSLFGALPVEEICEKKNTNLPRNPVSKMPDRLCKRHTRKTRVIYEFFIRDFY